MVLSPASARVLIVLRRVANAINLSTLIGWAFARSRGVALHPGPHGLLVAWEYPTVFPAPRNSAITFGDVVLVRGAQAVVSARHPKLLDHEARHAAQWALLVGPVAFAPLYGLASLWSLLRTGNPALANVFEVAAGLDDGGYRKRDKLAGPRPDGVTPA